MHLVLDPTEAALVAAVGLAQREKQCCPFFDVALDIGADRRTLSLRVPDGAEEAMATFVALLTDRERRRALGVDAELGDGVGHHRRLHPSVERELLQDGHHEVGRVDLEEPTQRGPGVGAAEPVGAERDVGPVDEARRPGRARRACSR